MRGPPRAGCLLGCRSATSGRKESESQTAQRASHQYRGQPKAGQLSFEGVGINEAFGRGIVAGRGMASVVCLFTRIAAVVVVVVVVVGQLRPCDMKEVEADEPPSRP